MSRPSLLVAVALLASFVSSFFAWRDGASALTFWAFAVLPNVGAGIVAAWVLHQEGSLLPALRPIWGDLTLALLATIVLFAAAYAFHRFVAPIGTARFLWILHPYQVVGAPETLRAHLPEVAITILLTTAAEEIVWRGMVTGALAESIGSSRAWVWSAVLYAVGQAPSALSLHSEKGLPFDPGPNPVLILFALGGGLVWGFLARRTRRLLPSILAHALFDWTILFLFRLSEPRF